MTFQIHSFENPFPTIIGEIFKNNYNYLDNLDELHKLFNLPDLTQEEKDYHKQLHEWSKDRNSVFVKKFHEYVDKHTIFNETYYNFLRTCVTSFPRGKSWSFKKRRISDLVFPILQRLGMIQKIQKILWDCIAIAISDIMQPK